MSRTLVPVVALACVCWSPSSALADKLSGAPSLLRVSGSYGYATAVGKNGAIYGFDRRTKTWTKDPVTVKADVVDVVMVSTRMLFALPRDGKVLKRYRGQWSVVPGISGGQFHGLAMAGSRRGAVVGSGGSVYHLVQSTWTKFHASPTTADLYAVARIGYGRSERFVAVGKGGVVLALAGVGSSLSADIEATPTKDDLVAIAACRGYRAEAVAVGGSTAVLRSRRDGRWKLLPAAPASLAGVTVSCRGGRVKRVYAVGGSTIYLLDVGKSTWKRYAMTAVAGLRSIAWLDYRRLVVVGNNSATVLAAKAVVKGALSSTGTATKVGAGTRFVSSRKRPFIVYSLARKLCDGRVYVRTGKHITWMWYVTSDSRARVSAYYRRIYGTAELERTKHADTWRFPNKRQPTEVVSVRPANTIVHKRSCTFPADAKTIIEFSRR